MYDFQYHRPATLSEAVDILSADEDAKLLAGGHTLLPTMKQRLAAPSSIVDLRDVKELKTIELRDDRLMIGAMCTHDAIANNPMVRAHLLGFSECAGLVGDPHVRHRGTIGGSIANNDPAADYPAAMLALNAKIITNQREIPIDEFLLGLFTTALESDEIVTHVSLPVDVPIAYEKFANPASRYAIVGVAVARGHRTCVGVTGAGSDGAFRWVEAEQALSASFDRAALSGLNADPSVMNTDLHASAEHRAALVRILAIRAVERLS